MDDPKYNQVIPMEATVSDVVTLLEQANRELLFFFLSVLEMYPPIFLQIFFLSHSFSALELQLLTYFTT